MPVRKVNKENSLSVEQQISKLTSLVCQLTIGSVQQKMVCGIYTNTGHPTDMCSILQDENNEQNMAGNVPTPRRQSDPFSNSYNPGWRDHPNFSYGGNWKNFHQTR